MSVMQAIFKIPEKYSTALVTRLHGVLDFQHCRTRDKSIVLSQGQKINCQGLKHHN